MNVEFLVVGHYLKELEVDDVKTCGVVLRYLNLLEQWLTQDSDGDILMLFEQIYEVVQHKVSNLYFPVKFNQNEGQSLVKHWRDSVFFHCKLVE